MKENVNQNCAEAHQSLRKEKFEDSPFIHIMTRDEVAKFLRVHPSTITRYAKSGEIQSYKLGSRRLFRYNDVIAFFENLVDREYVFGEEL